MHPLSGKVPDWLNLRTDGRERKRAGERIAHVSLRPTTIKMIAIGHVVVDLQITLVIINLLSAEYGKISSSVALRNRVQQCRCYRVFFQTGGCEIVVRNRITRGRIRELVDAVTF